MRTMSKSHFVSHICGCMALADFTPALYIPELLVNSHLGVASGLACPGEIKEGN